MTLAKGSTVPSPKNPNSLNCQPAKHRGFALRVIAVCRGGELF